MYQVTTQQSAAITQALREAESKIAAIVQQPVAVLLTSPRVILGDNNLSDFVEHVFAAIEAETNITASMLRSRERTLYVCSLRHIAFKIIKESVFRPSYKKVGRLFLRDHSTVINGINVINNDIAQSATISALYDSILNNLQKRIQ